MPFTGHVFFCVYQLLLAGLVRGLWPSGCCFYFDGIIKVHINL